MQKLYHFGRKKTTENMTGKVENANVVIFQSKFHLILIQAGFYFKKLLTGFYFEKILYSIMLPPGLQEENFYE